MAACVPSIAQGAAAFGMQRFEFSSRSFTLVA